MSEKIYPKLEGYPDHMSIAKTNSHKKLSGFITAKHHDADGNLIWENAAALIDLGEEHMLKGWVQGVANSIPSGFKLNLVTDTTIGETATTFTAITGTGYAEVAIAHDATDWTATLDSGDWQVKSKDCVFTATGTDWQTANIAVLEATLNSSDTLISYSDLTQARTIGNGESLTVTITLKLS